jgi:hypothetical protein
MPEFVAEEPDITVPADEKTLMLVFGLSPMEARFLQTMLMTTGWVGHAELPEVRYSKRQVIYTMRKKLERRKVWIINDGDGRYSMPATSKETVRDQITKVTQSE